ncbi:putative ribonuclease H-like domain-containing protein [Tanacetum coccineum]
MGASGIMVGPSTPLRPCLNRPHWKGTNVIQVSDGLGPQKKLIFLSNVHGNLQIDLQDHGVIDSRCSRHMTGNMSYLTDYEEIDRGYVAFGGNPKGGKITGKVAERRNRTLIEAARTMLADSKLPTTFWAEAVNTACYVQNRVYKSKCYADQARKSDKLAKSTFCYHFGADPHFQDPRVLKMRITNPSSDDERSYKLFDLSIDNEDVVEELKKVIHALKDPSWIEAMQEELLQFKLQKFGLWGFTNGKRLVAQGYTQEKGIDYDEVFAPVARIKAIRLFLAYASFKDFVVYQMDGREEDGIFLSQDKFVGEILEEFGLQKSRLQAHQWKLKSLCSRMKMVKKWMFICIDDDQEDGAWADMNNLDTTIQVSPILTIRIHKDHPLNQVIGDLQSTIQRRNMLKNLKEHGFVSTIQQRTNHKDLQNCLFACFLSQEEPKKVIHALKDPSWIEAMQEELLQFKLQEVWTLVELPNRKRAIGTKWVFRNKKDERGIVIRNKARLVAQGYTQ